MQRPFTLSAMKNVGIDDSVMTQLIKIQKFLARCLVNAFVFGRHILKYLSRASPKMRNDDDNTID